VADTLHAALFDKATVDFAIDGITSHADEAPKGIFGDPDKPTEAKAGEDKKWKGEVLVRRRGSLVFPVEIEMIDSDGNKTRTNWDGKARRRGCLRGKERAGHGDRRSGSPGLARR